MASILSHKLLRIRQIGRKKRIPRHLKSKSNHNNHSTKSTIPSLPEDIILEILSRLPSKSLAKFRCVCKSWQNLTTNSSFIKLRLCRLIGEEENHLLFSTIERNTKPSYTTLFDKNGNVIIESALGISLFSRTHVCFSEVNSFGLGFRLDNPIGETFHHDCRVVGSCNGIVCLVISKVMCLWNPCTSEYKIVEFENDFRIDYAVCGFGYDLCNEDYKLVIFRDSGNYDCKSNAMVYSVNDVLSSVVRNIPYKVLELRQGGVYLSGAIHWVAAEKVLNEKTVVIAFDVKENSCRKVSKPVHVNDDVYVTIGVLKGELCMLCKYYETGVEVWVMKEYGICDSWTKLFDIKKSIVSHVENCMSSDISYYDNYLRPLCLASNGELLLKDGEDLLSYDPTTKSATKLKLHGVIGSSDDYAVENYVPSLTKLHSGTYTREALEIEGEEKGC